MIYEVRIFSRIGSSIYAVEFNIEGNRIKTTKIDKPSLFSSMMSAILSFDSEVGRTQVREFIYEDNKAVLHFLDNIGFLIFADNKVRNQDLEDFLHLLAKRWLKRFEDEDYMYLTDIQLNLISKLVDQTIVDIFWWIKRFPTPKNLFRIAARTLFQPSSTYYTRYLSNFYHILAILPPILIILLSQWLGVQISGFSTRAVSDPSFLSVATPVFIFWLAPAIFLKAAFGNKFNLRSYLTISGLMTTYLVLLLGISSSFYLNKIVLPILQNSGVFSSVTRIFLILAPVNLSFFGYFILTGYSTSFSNDIPQYKFFIAYVLVTVFLISLTSVIAV